MKKNNLNHLKQKSSRKVFYTNLLDFFGKNILLSNFKKMR